MSFISTVVIILFFSFILALLSMKDLGFADELRKILDRKKIRGTIVFFKNKIIHYSSKSSFSSSKGASG